MTTAGGGGRSLRGKQRLKTPRGRTAQSQRWLERQLNDPYVRAAKADGYRSRAAYKLLELNERFGFLNGVRRVLDLGAAPGGWCQVVAAKKREARIVAIDLLPIDPLPRVTIFQDDVRTPGMAEQLRIALDGPADLVLSDMAANTVGHKQTDHLRTMGLVELALDMAEDMLEEGGTFVAKVLAGGADTALMARLKQRFRNVKHAKPPASRKESSEWYVVAQGFRAETEKTSAIAANSPLRLRP